MKMLEKGILISIEGIDGSGKSTFAKNYYQLLLKKNLPVVMTKEPGATTLGLKLREILQKKEFPVNNVAEFLLFAADRAQHFNDFIIPNLNAKKIIISDRMADSSLAYQGYARGLDLQRIKEINSWAMNEIKPDYIFYLKVDIDVAFERIHKRNETLTDFEKKDFLKKVADGFEEIFKDKKNVITLDANKSEENILKQAENALTF